MIGACIFMTANETRDLMWMGSPIQTIAKFIVHSIFIVTNVCNIACLEKISSRNIITSLQTFSNTSDKKRLINDLN